MANTATRLISLIMLLQRQPNQKAADLAGELGVSVRTLHRYLGMLEDLGLPVYSERGPYGGFSLVRGYRMPPLVFTPEEAVVVYLGASLVEGIWGALYSQESRTALAKLDNILPENQRQEVEWARRSLFAIGLQRPGFENLTSLLQDLRQAVRDHRKVRILYHSLNQPEPAERLIDPYALLHRWGWWYVVGYCHLRQDERSFRLDRIQKWTVLNETFEIPTTFDISAYLTVDPQFNQSYTATVRFSPQAVHVAYESRSLWRTITSQPDGSVIATLTSPTLEWAASTILAFGALVEVVEPIELRRLVAKWAGQVAKKYTSSAQENLIGV